MRVSHVWGRPLLALSLAFGLSACAVAKDPGWLKETPRDTPEALYGVADGRNADEARRNALRQISARLRSAISGSVSSDVTDNGGRVTRKDSIETKEQVIETEFSAVEVQGTEKGGAGVFVLVKVDRPAFLRDTRNQIGVLDAPVREVETALPGQSSLEQFVALSRVKPQIERARALSLLLAGAGAQSDGQASAARYGALLQQAEGLSTKLAFELRAPPADSDIASAVGGFLADNGMRSATTPLPGASVLTIQSQAREAEIGGSKITKLTVRLSVADEQGRAVTSREYAASGSSRFDFKGSRSAAVARLVAELRTAGPVAGLGFKP